MLLPATKVVGSFFVGALLSKCHSERSEESECGEYGEYREYREYREFREFRELSDSALPSLPILPTLPSLPMTALYIMRLFCLFVFNCQILRLRLRSAQDDRVGSSAQDDRVGMFRSGLQRGRGSAPDITHERLHNKINITKFVMRNNV